MSLARVQYVFTVLFLLYELSHIILITSLPESYYWHPLDKMGVLRPRIVQGVA